MPKKGSRKNSKKIKQQNQETNLRSAEKKKLTEMLKERDLFRPGMKIQEMRELCSVIEASLLDHEVHQRSNQFNELNGNFLDEDFLTPILRDFALLDTPASSEKINAINDPSTPPTDTSPPKIIGRGQTSPNVVPGFSPLTSPTAAKATIGGACSKQPSYDTDDSDGEFYSPEFQGPCCRKYHVVEVEVHPEPRAKDCERDDDDGRRIASPGIRSPSKQVKLAANAWDAIDEVP